ncbi:MAG: CusA/CzcA family heavy metal efflux RND transporter [Bacteroidales bacterium]|nr:CusA/CzcA family heavy metal efflux RND transporter [Bacteroidales bacterium]
MERIQPDNGLLNKIIAFSLNNRTVILVIAALCMVAGIYSASRSEVDVFPDLNAPTVVVMTEAEGMAPEEVERLVTFPIETAVNGATNVRRVRSSSTTGFSIVNIEFDWGTDIYRARQIVSEKIAMVGSDLPPNAGNPTLGPQASILGELMIISLSADNTSMQDLRTIADWTIRPRLLSLGGVAQVAVMGGDIKEYQILLDPGRMRHFGVSLDEVLAAVREMNQNAPGGTLYEYGNEYIVRGVLSTNDIRQLEKAVVKTDAKGLPITLEAIAEVTVGPKTPVLGVASNDGRPAVIMTVTKQPNTSTLELTGKLDRELADIRTVLPEDVHVNTDIFRQSRFIEASIDNVKKSLLEGGIFVVLILFIFLMNWRTTVISLVSIPLSILITLLVTRWMGLSINTMSLGGIAIAIGSLVDDSIVDVENVFKRLRAARGQTGKSVLQVVYDASKEVRMPMLNSTLIIIACFLPLFFLSGMEGRMLKPLGIAFIISLCTSTLVALTVTPVLSSQLLAREMVPDEAGKKRTPREAPLVRWLKNGYGRALVWALRHWKSVIGTVAVLFSAAVIMFLSLGRSFLPAFNEGSFTIAMSSVPGISIEESDRLGRQAEEILMSIPEIRTVGRKTGRAELDEHAFGVNCSEFECPFELKGKSKRELVEEVREKLSVLPGVNLEIGGPISHRIDAMLSGTQANIAIKVFGTDLNKMYSIGQQIKSSISGIEGITDINVEQQVERPELNIVPRRERLARYGITLPEFSEFVKVMLEGEPVSTVYEGNRAFDLTLKVKGGSKSSMERIEDLMIDTPSGGKIPLSYVADIVSSAGPNTISRENLSRKLVVSCNATNGELAKAVAAIRREISEHVTLPDDYRIEYGGQFESEERASRTIALVSMFSLLIIFLLLLGEFKDAGRSMTVLLNLPLALIGGVMTVYFSDGILSIPAIIGFISLFGIATRNGMLLIDRYNALAATGLSVAGTIMKGSLDRLNPILMTAVTSALALLPLALGGDLPGNEIQSPMAKVILGGLLSSTLLNGFVIPVIYLITNKKNNKI